MKIHMISLQYYRDSGDKVQYETTTEKYIVTCNMLVDTEVHPGLSSYTG